MMKINGPILVLVLMAFDFGKASELQKLFLTVYYESNCPDSKSFILKQLVPAVSLLNDHLKLLLIPFGKSRSINYGADGFECQHGKSECLGNIVQDCALDLMRDQSDVDKVAYVACEMETRSGSNGDLRCVDKANLSTTEVHRCVTYGKGIDLQLDSEYLTKLVKPHFIPTVTLNGIFNQQIQDFSQIDLTGTLCSILKETLECGQYYNNMALNDLFYSYSV